MITKIIDRCSPNWLLSRPHAWWVQENRSQAVNYVTGTTENSLILFNCNFRNVTSGTKGGSLRLVFLETQIICRFVAGWQLISCYREVMGCFWKGFRNVQTSKRHPNMWSYENVSELSICNVWMANIQISSPMCKCESLHPYIILNAFIWCLEEYSCVCSFRINFFNGSLFIHPWHNYFIKLRLN